MLCWFTLVFILDVHSLPRSVTLQGAAGTVLPSLGAVKWTSSWTGLLSLCQREGRERRKRSLEEHIFEVQRPSDIAQNHIAFEHEGAESETHGIHSLPVTYGLRSQGKPEHLKATEVTRAGSQWLF